VFFGATGDLAYKKIFPALQAMLKHGHLTTYRSRPLSSPNAAGSRPPCCSEQLGKADCTDGAIKGSRLPAAGRTRW